MMPVFRPRGPIVSDPPRVSNSPPSTPQDPQALPPNVVAIPADHRDYGLGRGDIRAKSAPSVSASPLVTASRTAIAQSRAAQENGFGLGGAVSRSAPPTSFTPATLIRSRVVSMEEVFLPGGVLTLLGGVNTVGTTPKVVYPAIAQREPEKPDGGRVISLLGGVPSSAREFVSVPVVTTRLIEGSPPGAAYASRGGVDSASLTARANPVIIVSQEPQQPFQGDSWTRIGGVATVDTTRPAPAPLMASRQLAAYQYSQGESYVFAGLPQLNRLPHNIIHVRDFGPPPMFGLGEANISTGKPESASLNTPGIVSIAFRMPAPGQMVDGSVRDGTFSRDGSPLIPNIPSKPLIAFRHSPIETWTGSSTHNRGGPESAAAPTPRRTVVSFRLESDWMRRQGWSYYRAAPGATAPFVGNPPLVNDYFNIDQVIDDEFNIGDNGVVTHNQVVFVGDVRRIQVSGFTRDGAAWAITSATLKMVSPSNVVTSYSATQEAAALWYYDTVSSEISAAGLWRCYWVLSDGSVTIRHEGEPFVARDVN